ncbi:MAG: TonB-dependent receptor, partial [Tannerellaceae bacterium]|nr:TonB-dependent receptor [Tannerellaceae bacterium]
MQYRQITGTLLLCLLACIMPVKAQTDRPIPSVTLDRKNVPLEEIFRELEKQTGMFFSYESSLLKDAPKASLRVENESFHYCLKALFEKLPFIYRITGQYVIVKRKPQQYTISGFIRDSVTYESLIQATLVEQITGKGVVTNNYGFYSITLPAGEVILSSSYVGYDPKEIRFILSKDTLLELTLLPISAMQEIVVRAVSSSGLESSRMGNLQLHTAQFMKTPVLFSEPDPVKTLHLTPGVAFGTEAFTGMYVRGGGGDENLFLIDGIPIYHTSHVGGIFSTFNPDIIKHVDFYKGGFPARYGGRLSSVMDIRLNEGDMKEYHGSAGIGLISAKAHFEGPLVKDRTSFNIAFRRTWLDAITTPILAIANRRREDGGKYFVGYSFYDLNTKINHLFTPRSRLYLNFYMGQDRLRYEESYQYYGYDVPQDNGLIWRWGNLLAAVNWTYVFNSRLFANFNVAYTRYKSKMSDWETLSYWNGKDSYSTEENRNSGIENIGYKIDFDYQPHIDHAIKFGTDYLFHIYQPEQLKEISGIYEGVEWQKRGSSFIDEHLSGHELSLYAEDDWRIHEKWKLNIGGRGVLYHVQDSAYFSFQPRISARYLWKENLSLKASYAKMNQYNHQLSNTYLQLPSAIWVPVTKKIRPMSSHQVSVGAYYKLKQTWDLSAELYYKKMNHILEYKDYSSLFPEYVKWDEKVSMGSGRSYGVEYMIRKPEGRTTGWLAYTLSWSDRYFPDGNVNEGKRFPDRYDNRHKINVTVNHTFNKTWDMSIAWVYTSGNRASVKVDGYDPPQIDGEYPGSYFPEAIYKKNAVKMRAYHRMDVSFNYYRPKKKGRMGIWNISFYFLYCRMISFALVLTTVQTRCKATFREVGLMPLIPC